VRTETRGGASATGAPGVNSPAPSTATPPTSYALAPPAVRAPREPAMESKESEVALGKNSRLGDEGALLPGRPYSLRSGLELLCLAPPPLTPGKRPCVPLGRAPAPVAPVLCHPCVGFLPCRAWTSPGSRCVHARAPQERTSRSLLLIRAESSRRLHPRVALGARRIRRPTGPAPLLRLRPHRR
jgi:hypothetical protein